MVSASDIERSLRERYVAALFDPKGRYRYWHGFNLVAVAWTVIGVVI